MRANQGMQSFSAQTEDIQGLTAGRTFVSFRCIDSIIVWLWSSIAILRRPIRRHGTTRCVAVLAQYTIDFCIVLRSLNVWFQIRSRSTLSPAAPTLARKTNHNRRTNRNHTVNLFNTDFCTFRSFVQSSPRFHSPFPCFSDATTVRRAQPSTCAPTASALRFVSIGNFAISTSCFVFVDNVLDTSLICPSHFL